MKENARIEAFSDGVFAIAITLLILEIKVPAHESIHSVNDLWKSLFGLWPSYFAFFLSFGIILVSWVNHHYLFNILSGSSRSFLYANGFLLLTITFMPFPTALLAEYIGTEYAKPAIAFYCFGGVVNSIGWILVLNTVLKPCLLLHNKVDVELIYKIRRTTLLGLLVYSLSTGLAFWFPVAALILNLLLWIVWITLSINTKTT
jgi:uncharacterized membrane protein